jgi:hypothetical protein
MAQDPDEKRLEALKDQFKELKRCESASGSSLEEIFDAEIRRRFGEMIYRATIGTPKDLKD